MHITKKRIQEIIQEELIAEASFLDKIYDTTATPDVPEYKEGPANKLKGMTTQSKYKEKTQELKDTVDAAEGVATLASLGLGGAAIQSGKAILGQGLKKAAKTAAINVATDVPAIASNVAKAKPDDKLSTLGKSVATSAAASTVSLSSWLVWQVRCMAQQRRARNLQILQKCL